MSKRTKKQPVEQRGLGTELLLLLFVLLGVFFLLSLISYNEHDAAFFETVNTKHVIPIKNLFGVTGALVADIMGAALGVASLFVPFLCFYIALLLHQFKNGKVKAGVILGVVVAGILIISTFSLFAGLIGTESKDLFFTKHSSGGALGAFASIIVVSLVGRVGGIILSLAIMLILTMLMFHVSLSQVAKSVKSFVLGIVFIFAKLFSGIKRRKSNNVNKMPEEILDDSEREAIRKITFEAEEVAPAITEDIKDDEPIFKQPFIEEIEEKEEVIEIREQSKVDKKLISKYSIPISILSDPDKSIKKDSPEELKHQGELLIQKLKDFDVSGKVRAIQPGPVVTMFEIEPAAGTRISKIAGLERDLALSMSALSIRIIAPIPGTNTIGIEVPNKNRAGVAIKELLQAKEFANNKSELTIALGKDVTGKPFMSDIKKMPHLLVAGTTGSGKSVGINTMICSILYKSSPDKVKFVMIDPKMVELSIYRDIPHLLAPVVTDTKLAPSVLRNVVDEMERRYEKLMEKKVRNIEGYNEIVAMDGSEPEMFYLVVVVDEFADLMMVAGKDVETSITRIAQKARAVGIHLIIATQRPTANVITGLIKANMPARLAFKVAQSNDSRIILDQKGADMLLGYGDSLFIPPGTSDAIRIHGAFVSDEEVRNVVEEVKKFGEPEYDLEIIKDHSEEAEDNSGEKEDAKYQEALDLAFRMGEASISKIQRELSIGYNRAAKIFEMMERRGIIEPSTGSSKPRKVIRPRDSDY